MDHVDRVLAQWRRERPGISVAPMGTIGRITRLRQHLMRAMEKTFAEHGLNRASFDVLATLRRSGPPYALSPGDLMASTMVTSGTMTYRIDQLEEAGMIKRVKNPEDGRGFLISLSQQGYDLIDKAVTAHVETQARLVTSLTAGQRKQLDELLRQFLSGFEEEPNNT
ncbi:MAG: MarR family transcriptional regulator [Chthoniobacterales bacterium]|nr:MarR family transcriptional regulator [Chthoniobacterales bacterium]